MQIFNKKLIVLLFCFFFGFIFRSFFCLCFFFFLILFFFLSFFVLFFCSVFFSLCFCLSCWQTGGFPNLPYQHSQARVSVCSNFLYNLSIFLNYRSYSLSLCLVLQSQFIRHLRYSFQNEMDCFSYRMLLFMYRTR